jgi:uncharacterized membrane protein YgcG
MEIEDDLRRSRLTVFFRLLLAIPHIVWLILWSIAAVVAAVANWFATLFAGRSPQGLHNFLSAYVRYLTHVYAYVLLAANPFPGFTGTPGSYPVEVGIDPPARQRRWITAFRIVLALPALVLASTLVGSCGGGGGGGGQGGPGEGAGEAGFFFSSGGVALTVAFLAWFACLARGRMPSGFRDLVAYVLRYNAQVLAYVLLVTDRYPKSDPAERTPHPPPERPINLDVDDDRSRSRLTVFFRLLLALPHLVWLLLWTVLVFLVAIANWFVTLFAGRSPDGFHRFLSAYVRYDIHVFAFLSLVANPFPGFTGQPGMYPVDVRIEPRTRQNRWITGFRLLLAIPALLVTGALNGTLLVVGVLGWFASLATGRMPLGLRNLGAFALRYSAQVNGYIYLLTDRYPYSGPLRAAEEAEPEPAAALAEPV